MFLFNDISSLFTGWWFPLTYRNTNIRSVTKKLLKTVMNCQASQDKVNESHHMENARVLPLTSHSMGKCNKTHCMGKTLEISTHIFLIVWVLFSHPIPTLCYTSSLGKFMGFPINFLWCRKKNTAKPIELEEPGKLLPIISPKYGYLFFINFPSYGIIYHMEKAWLFPSISICSHQFLFIPKSGDSFKEQREKTDKVNSVFKKKKSIPDTLELKQNISKEEERGCNFIKKRNLNIY